MKIVQVTIGTALLAITTFSYAGGPLAGLSTGSGGAYFGLGLGITNSLSTESNLITSPNRCGEADAVCSSDDSHSGLKAFAGYEISNNIAIEGFYTDLNKVVESKIDQGGVSDQYIQETHGFGLSLIGKFRPTPRNPLSLKAKVGAFHWISEADGSFSPIVNGFGTATSRKDNGTSPMLSLGLEYPVSSRLLMYADWDRYFNVGESDIMLTEATSTWRTLKTDVDFLSLGFKYKF